MRGGRRAGGVRVAVVGGGVLGVSVAAALVGRGVETVLVDATGPGSGTSSRGAGLVCEGLWHPTGVALVRRSLELLDEMGRRGEEEGHPFRFHPTGSSTLVPEALVPAVRRLVARQRAWGAEVRTMGPDEAAALPRHASVRLDDAAEVVHYPRDGWALPRLYCEVLAYLLQDKGLRTVKGAARLRRDAEKVRLEVAGQPVPADAVVVAAGIHTRALLRGAGLDAPLAAYRTQALRFHHADAHEVPILHDAVQGFYLRPSWPGQLVAGDGTTTTPEDPDAWRREADAAFLEDTARRLRHRFPSLRDGIATEAWAGLDAATPDRLLLAGRHPDADDVWLLAGGTGHGFMRAPAAGESLAATLVGERPRVDLAPYDPARFRGRLDAPFAIREGYTLDAEG